MVLFILVQHCWTYQFFPSWLPVNSGNHGIASWKAGPFSFSVRVKDKHNWWMLAPKKRFFSLWQDVQKKPKTLPYVLLKKKDYVLGYKELKARLNFLEEIHSDKVEVENVNDFITVNWIRQWQVPYLSFSLTTGKIAPSRVTGRVSLPKS